MSIYQRVIATCTGLVLLTIISVSLMSYLGGERVLETSVKDRLAAIATNQRDQIVDVIEAWQDRVALIASRTQLRISLKDYLASNSPESLARVQTILADAQRSVRAVHTIEIGPASGPMIARVGMPLDVANYVELAPGRVSSGIFSVLADDGGQLYVQLAQPMFLDGEQVGRVLVTLEAGELLQTTATYTGLGNTGETMLIAVNRAGQPFYLTPLRFDPSVSLQPVDESAGESGLLQAALSGAAAILDEVIDYRGLPTMATTRYIPDLGWGLAVKMDRAEIRAPVESYRHILIILALILVAIAVGLGMVIANAIARPVSTLAEEARRISEGEHDLRATVSRRSGREIHDLAIAFNNLTDTLIQTNASLERKVQARTRELQELNESLERRVLEQLQAFKLLRSGDVGREPRDDTASQDGSRK